jgi:hypothetical protein
MRVILLKVRISSLLSPSIPWRVRKKEDPGFRPDDDRAVTALPELSRGSRIHSGDETEMA